MSTSRKRTGSRLRYLVVLSRMGASPSGVMAVEYEQVMLGPFRTRELAEARAAVVRKLADTYEDPEGVTGPGNALEVMVEPLRKGALSAQGALDHLYGQPSERAPSVGAAVNRRGAARPGSR